MLELRMSRDARKVFQLLDSLAIKYGVQGEISPAHIYMAETMLMKFHVTPIMNIIKSKIQSQKLIQDKHISFEYWSPVLINMLKHNSAAVRKDWIMSPPWLQEISDVQIRNFDIIINKYLLCDYSYQDMMIIMELVNIYTVDEIIYGCNTGRANKVYEPRYIKAVMEKERAKKSISDQEKDKVSQRVITSTQILDRAIHHHQPLDLVGMVSNWEHRKENADLEAKFNKMMNELDKNNRRDR